MISERDNPEHFVNSFESFMKIVGERPEPHLHSLRKSAISRLTETGFPTQKDEEWRFTDISRIARTKYTPVLNEFPRKISSEDLDPLLIRGLEGVRLTFVNGRWTDYLNRSGGASPDVLVRNLSGKDKTASDLIARHIHRHAGTDRSAFTSLNTGFLNDGELIAVPDDTVVDEPIYLVFLAAGNGSPVMIHPRNLIIAGKNSKISVVEHYLSLTKGSYFTNAVTEIVAGENSVVEHLKIENEDIEAFHVSSIYAEQNRGSLFTSNSFMTGGSIARNNITSVLGGDNCRCVLNGLSVAAGRQVIDNHTVIDHAEPGCSSHELFKSVLDGNSHGIFNGKIYVRKDAQKTDAKQTNKTILLSGDATVNTKPQLEIFADDVKCTHGATVGYLDAESIFYLRTRGIGLNDARDILTYAFANDLISRVTSEAARNHLKKVVSDKFKQR